MIGARTIRCLILAGFVAATALSGAPPWSSWQRINPLPTGSWINSIAFGGGTFVAVAYSDGVLRSEEGVVWERIAVPFGQAQKVRWLDGRFLAVGDDGLVASSTDGSHWRIDRDGGGEKLVDVARSGGRLAAVAADGRVLLSDDGANWEPASAPPEASLAAVCGGPWGFVAVGEGVFYSRDGESWVQEVPPEHPWVSVFDVLWTGERYVAVDWESVVLTSLDGETWASTPIPTVVPRAIGWNGNELVAVGGSSVVDYPNRETGTVAVSTDGESWTSETVGDHVLDGVAWGSGQWVAVGSSGTILANPSGQGWVSRSSPAVWDLSGVAVGDGRVAAVGGVMSAHGGSQRSILVSDSGVGFVLRDAKPATPLYDVTWTGSRWVAVGYAGQVATSDNSVDWSLSWLGFFPEDDLYGVAAGGGTVVGVGDKGGAGVAVVSSDGRTWSERALGLSASLRSVVWTGSRFVAVGDSGDVALSDRGYLWTVVPGALPFTPQDVVWNGEELLAVGWGWSARSVDGTTWTATEAAPPIHLSSLAWGDGRFIGVAGDGYAVSTDGINWQTGTVAPGIVLLGVTADAEGAFAVGWNGAIYRLLLGERAFGPAPPGRAKVVPVTAHTAGLRGTAWESDVTVLPATGDAAEVWLGIRGRGGSTGLWWRFVIPPGGLLFRGGILTATFGLNRAVEPLWVVSESPLVVSSRTSTAGAGGRFGEGVTPVLLRDNTTEDGRILLVGLDENGARRTDVGITNLTGDTVTAVIDLYRPDGSPIGSRAVDAAPYAVVQINRIIADLTDEQVSAAYAVVSGPPAGSFTAYASVIDNVSGDPVFIPPATIDAGPLVLPAVVHTSGLGGTEWTSVVDVVNGGDGPAMFHFELLPEGGGEVRTSGEIELPRGEARHFPDIMASLFPGARAGALRVVPDSDRVAVTSRTANTGGRGTFGQAMPALPESEAFASGESALLSSLGSSSEVRTNIGLVNLGDASIVVRVDLHAAGGELLGTVTRPLPAHSWAQLDRVYQWVTRSQVVIGYAVVTSESSAGSFLTYASVIDNASGDPVTVVGMHAQQ